MRIFNGAEYYNCDHFTDEEMKVVSDWENTPEEARQALMKKSGWRKTGLFKRDAEQRKPA